MFEEAWCLGHGMIMLSAVLQRPFASCLVFAFLFTFVFDALVAARQEASAEAPHATQASILPRDLEQQVSSLKAEVARLKNENQALQKYISESRDSVLARLKQEFLKQEMDLRISEISYKKKELDIIQEAFEWQANASVVLLYLVVFIALIGIIFSGIQLWKAYKLSDPQTETTLEVSAGKIRITSSIVGIIILTISLGFMYLFLQEVYPIREVG